jgi:hypothetical protein
MLKFIEKPREENLAAKNSFTSLLTNGEMSSVMGGATCTTFEQCPDGQSGKNVCTGGFSCTLGLRTECTQKKTWAIPTNLSNLSGINII